MVRVLVAIFVSVIALLAMLLTALAVIWAFG